MVTQREQPSRQCSLTNGFPMHDLASFSLGDMILCCTTIRNLCKGAKTMEETAGRIVHFLHTELADRQTGRPNCGLVRFYKVHSYGGLDETRQRFVASILGAPPVAETRCLTLLATAGDEPDWRSTAQSRGHLAIPLASKEEIGRLPMVAQPRVERRVTGLLMVPGSM